MDICYRRDDTIDLLDKEYFSKRYIDEINKTMNHSPNIHIILFDNGSHSFTRICRWYDSIRNGIPKVVKKLIEKYKNDHILVVYYGKSVRPLCPVLPLIDDIDEHIYNIMAASPDFDEDISRDMVTDAFKTRSIISKPEFGFLVKYDKLFIHEVE